MLRTIFEVISYPILALLFLSWLFSLFALYKATDFRGWFAKHRTGLVLSILLAAFVVNSIEPEFRTLSDEPNLVSVSQSFFQTKFPRLITSGKHYFENFNTLVYQMPNRPLVFPFILSLVHSLFGFDYTNVFWLNGFVFFLLLFLGYYIGAQFFSITVALSIPFAIAAQPIISISAASGGFDLFSALAILYSLFATKIYLHRKDKESLYHLALTLLLMAQIRYENILYVIIIGAFLVAIREINIHKARELGVRAFALPLLILPSILQRLLVEARAYQVPKGDSIFSFGHLLTNTNNLAASFFDFRFYYPYATYLNIAALLLGIIAIVLCRHKVNELLQDKKVFHLTSISLALYMLVILAYFFGNPAHPSSARYFILLFACISISLPFLVKIVLPKFNDSSILVMGVFFWFLYHSVAVEHRFINTLTINRETRFEYEFLDRLEGGNPLIVAERPGHFTIRRKSAIGFNAANQQADKVLAELRQNLFSDILVFQRIVYKNGEAHPNDTLDSKYKLETLEERQTSAKEFVRISRVQRQSTSI